MLPLMIGMGLPAFAVIAYALPVRTLPTVTDTLGHNS